MNPYEAYNQTLAGHRIASVGLRAFRARYPRLHGKNAIRGVHGYGGTVRVAVLTTDQGATGWGALCRRVAPEDTAKLQGARLSDVFAAETGILDEVYTAFDIALHDLAGNILGIPVRTMINPDAQPRAKVYDGAIYMNDIIPEEKPFGPDKVLAECADDVAMGHRILKVKIGRGHQWMPHAEGMARDIQIVRAIHEAFPHVEVMVDANDGYTFEDCAAFLEGIGDCEIYWFEEPFREEESANRRLREYLKAYRPATLIADGESDTNIPLLFDLAGKGLLDIWQPDVCGYGFTAWRKLLKEIAPLGYRSSPHAWGQVVKTHYCAHLAAAYPHHIPCVEAVLGESEGVDYGGYVLQEGVLTLPERPGFGMELFWSEPV